MKQKLDELKQEYALQMSEDLEYDVAAVKEKLLNDKRIPELKKVLKTCTCPKDLCSKWEVLHDRLEKCDPDERVKIIRLFNLGDSGYGGGDSANGRLAKLLGVSESFLGKALSPGSTHNFFDKDGIRRLEILLGYQENELLYSRTKNLHTSQRFKTLDRITQYRLATEWQIYEQMPIESIVFYYSLPAELKRAVDYLVNLLNLDVAMFGDDPYIKGLVDIRNETNEILEEQYSQAYEEFKHEFEIAHPPDKSKDKTDKSKLHKINQDKGNTDETKPHRINCDKAWTEYLYGCCKNIIESIHNVY